MAKIVLRYFECQGRAEALRVILADSGVPFDDDRVPLDATWPVKVKPDPTKSGPFQCLPVLNWDSHIIPQTEAIAMYLASKLNYAGDGSPEQAAHCAALCSAAHQDIVQVAIKFLYSPLSAPHKTLEESFHDAVKSVTPRLSQVQEYLGEKSYFLSDEKPCAGDFFLYVAFDQLLDIFGEELFRKFGRLKDFHRRVAERPNVKAYLDSGRKMKRLTGSSKEDEVLEKAKEFKAKIAL
eukprot:m.90365 g.90365  ORF g.90365 m.90365 type:complete len:237 (+) comp36643_c0_seq1:429-1139(+)